MLAPGPGEELEECDRQERDGGHEQDSASRIGRRPPPGRATRDGERVQRRRGYRECQEQLEVRPGVVRAAPDVDEHRTEREQDPADAASDADEPTIALHHGLTLRSRSDGSTHGGTTVAPPLG